MPGPARPVPVAPVPVTISIGPADGMSPDGPVRLVLVTLVTAAGSAFGFFVPDQLERVLSDGLRICAAQRAGLVVPVNGIIRPGGQP